jgi:hypothetical protein
VSATVKDLRRRVVEAERSLVYAKNVSFRAFRKAREAHNAAVALGNALSEPMHTAVLAELQAIEELARESYAKGPGYRLQQLARFMGAEGGR